MYMFKFQANIDTLCCEFHVKEDKNLEPSNSHSFSDIVFLA